MEAYPGAFVLDVDGKAGRASLVALEGKFGKLPETLCISTGRTDGGMHYYFVSPEGLTIASSTSVIAAGLDIRGKGSQVIVPPSIHKTGAQYKVLSAEDHIAHAPPWLLDLVAVKHKTSTTLGLKEDALRSLLHRIAAHEGLYRDQLAGERFQKGSRNHDLFRVACAMRARRESGQTIYRELRRINQEECLPSLPLRQVKTIAQSACKF